MALRKWKRKSAVGMTLVCVCVCVIFLHLPWLFKKSPENEHEYELDVLYCTVCAVRAESINGDVEIFFNNSVTAQSQGIIS